MAITVTRTKTDMIGTPTSAASIAAAGNSTGTLDNTTPAGVISSNAAINVITGSSAPTSPISIACSYSNDGTNYTADPLGTYSIGTPGTSTTYTYRYDPPDSCSKVQVKITNGATNGITAWVQGQNIAVS